jgi:hypothetical protein
VGIAADGNRYQVPFAIYFRPGRLRIGADWQDWETAGNEDDEDDWERKQGRESLAGTILRRSRTFLIFVPFRSPRVEWHEDKQNLGRSIAPDSLLEMSKLQSLEEGSLFEAKAI